MKAISGRNEEFGSRDKERYPSEISWVLRSKSIADKLYKLYGTNESIKSSKTRWKDVAGMEEIRITALHNYFEGLYLQLRPKAIYKLVTNIKEDLLDGEEKFIYNSLLGTSGNNRIVEKASEEEMEEILTIFGIAKHVNVYADQKLKQKFEKWMQDNPVFLILEYSPNRFYIVRKTKNFNIIDQNDVKIKFDLINGIESVKN